MRRFLSLALLISAVIAAASVPLRAEYPKPSPYPKSWELEFEHGKPKRIVVQAAGTNAPRAYWYLTYTITNNTDQEQLFLPSFELLTEDGKVVRNDKRIPAAVFDEIKRREGTRFLETAAQVGGQLRIGSDQARDSVAIWPEPSPEMGQFSIFVSGLSGEIAMLKGPSTTQPVILRKTLQLNYIVRGDDVYPGEDEVNENPEEWVMR